MVRYGFEHETENVVRAIYHTGQDRTGQDRTGQDRTGQDRTGQAVEMLVGLSMLSIHSQHLLLLCMVIVVYYTDTHRYSYSS